MTTKKMIIPAALVALLAGGSLMATSASAAPHQDHGGKHEMQAQGDGVGNCPMMQGGHGQGKMQLSPEQRAKMRTLVQEADTKLRPLREQLYVKREEMRALQNAATPDVKAVGQKAQEINTLREQMHKERQALGDRIDKELGLEPGTHNFSGYGHKGGHGGQGR